MSSVTAVDKRAKTTAKGHESTTSVAVTAEVDSPSASSDRDSGGSDVDLASDDDDDYSCDSSDDSDFLIEEEEDTIPVRRKPVRARRVATGSLNGDEGDGLPRASGASSASSRASGGSGVSRWET